MTVLMGTVADLPVVKAMLAIRRDIFRAFRAINVPFADIGGVVTGFFEGIA